MHPMPDWLKMRK